MPMAQRMTVSRAGIAPARVTTVSAMYAVNAGTADAKAIHPQPIEAIGPWNGLGTQSPRSRATTVTMMVQQAALVHHQHVSATAAALHAGAGEGGWPPAITA